MKRRALGSAAVPAWAGARHPCACGRRRAILDYHNGASKNMNSRLALLMCSACAGACANAYANEVHEPNRVEVQGKKESASTGSKLGLSIKETPASIEVLDAETMERRGDTTVIRAVTKAAGITGGSSGHGTAGNYSVRGFAGYPGIDFLHDGIKLNGTIFSKRSLDVASLDRIEIIRGAASVLNGDGSVGATVNLISKKPDFQQEETEFGIKGGSHDSYRFNFGRAGVAVEDKLAYRVDAVTRKIGSDYDGEQRRLDSLSVSLLFKIDNDLLTSLSFDTSRDDARQDYQGTPLVNGKLDRRVQNINYNNLADGVDAGDSLWLKHRIEWRPARNVELNNQLVYQKASADTRRLYLAVQDAANPGLVNRRGYDSSQEQNLLENRLDLIGRGDVFGLRNRALVGLALSRMELNREQSTYAGRILSTPMFRPARLYYRDFFNPTADDYKKPDADIRLKQLAVYAEDQLGIAKNVTAVAGIRYDRYDIDYDFKPGLSSPIAQLIRKKHNKFSYRGGLVVDVTDSANLYASYTSSFEPGDASASFLTVNAAQTRLDLTKANQMEAGLKQSFAGGKGALTAAVYQITKKNMFVNNPTPGAGLLNVGQQTSTGMELSLGLRPTEQLQVDANLSHVDAKYDEFVHNGVDYAGRTPSSVPKHVANLGVRYTPLAKLGIGAWVKHVGSFYTDNIGFANSVRLPRSTVVDFTLDYAFDKNVTVSVLLKNVGDELYATTARRDAQVFLGEGRGLEVGVNYRF